MATPEYMEKVQQYLEQHAQAKATREWLEQKNEQYPGMDYARNLLAMMTTKASIVQTTEKGTPEREKAAHSLATAILLYATISSIKDEDLLNDLNYLEDSVESVTADLRKEFPDLTHADLTPEMKEKLKTIGYNID